MRLKSILLLTIPFFMLACRAGEATAKKPAGPEDPRRHYETAGGYSVVPPPGWETIDFPAAKYKVFTAAANNGFAANINIVDEGFAGPLTLYVIGNLNAMKALPGFKKLSQEDLELDSGADAVKVVAATHQMGNDLRQSFYFIPGKGKKYVVTCTQLAAGQDETAACDTAARSFRVEGS